MLSTNLPHLNNTLKSKSFNPALALHLAKNLNSATLIDFTTTPVQATVLSCPLPSPLPAATSTKIRNRNHVTRLFTTAGWLSTELKIQTKSLTLVCKALDDLAPAYLSDLISSQHPHVLDSNHVSLFLELSTPFLLSAYTAPSSTHPMARSFLCLSNQTGLYNQTNLMELSCHLLYHLTYFHILYSVYHQCNKIIVFVR